MTKDQLINATPFIFPAMDGELSYLNNHKFIFDLDCDCIFRTDYSPGSIPVLTGIKFEECLQFTAVEIKTGSILRFKLFDLIPDYKEPELIQVWKYLKSEVQTNYNQAIENVGSLHDGEGGKPADRAFFKGVEIGLKKAMEIINRWDNLFYTVFGLDLDLIDISEEQINIIYGQYVDQAKKTHHKNEVHV
jgi:hypothetical protein